MKCARNSLSLCGYSGRLIALGGHNGKTLSRTELYRVASNKWEEMPSLQVGR